MFGARALAIGTTTALIATIGAFGAASAATTGDVTVTVTTVSTLQLTLVDGSAAFGSRSEEHTSELQSRSDLRMPSSA